MEYNEMNVIEQQPNEKEEKPLMVWFDSFELALEELGGKYKNIEPTDVVELYYEDVPPKDAASKLMLESGKE